MRLINVEEADRASFDNEQPNDVLKKRRKLTTGESDQFERELCTFFNEESNMSNPFGWWKDNSARYPTLCKIGLFIIPASSAPIERTFSVAKLLTDGLRNRTGVRLLNDRLIVYLNRDIK